MNHNCEICDGSGVIRGTSHLPDVACTCQRQQSPQNQPTSRLDEVAEKCARNLSIHSAHPGRVRTIKRALQEYTTDLHQSLTKANEELVELRKDKMRLDWMERGHALMALANPLDPNKPRYSADFHEQDWKEYTTAREAIDSAITAQEKMK